MPDQHCKASPSSAHRWLACTRSLAMEAPFPNTTSPAAEQGTHAHSMGEEKVRKRLHQECPARDPTPYDDDEMEYYTDFYADLAVEKIQEAREFCGKGEDPLVLVEQRLSFEDIIPGGFGTSDLLIGTPKKLFIIDFKYGKGVLVHVAESDEFNPQLGIYAWGAYTNLRCLYPDVESVEMTIVQPRINNVDSYEVPIKRLREWATDYVRPRALMALAGEGELVPGEHCRFCRAKHVCRARAEEALALLREEFTVIDGEYETSQGAMPMYRFKSPAQLTQEEIEDVLPVLNSIQDWIGSVFTYITDEAIRNGKKWKGYKLVEGRSNRTYTSEKQVEETCLLAGYSDIYSKSLLPLTKLEKRLTKPVFRTLIEGAGLVVKPKGKLTLVREDDSRKEAGAEAIPTRSSAEDDFTPIGE